MGAFDDLIPAFRTTPKVPATRGAFDDLIPSKGAVTRSVPAIRPSEVMHEGIKRSFGETAADIAGYIPPVAAAKMVADVWSDAYQHEKANPEGNDGMAMLAQQTNLLDAASQGVSPHVDSHTLIGPVSSESAGGMKFYRDAQGGEQPFDASTQVILTDPHSGKQSVYLKGEDSEEGGLVGASRVLTSGMLTGPVTGIARGVSAVGRNAGNVAAARSSQAADDVAAFDRVGVEPFSPAFMGETSRSVAKGLSDTWGIGAPIRSKLEQAHKGMADASNRIADNLSSVKTYDEAGQSLQGGLDRYRTASLDKLEPDVVRGVGVDPVSAVPATDVMPKAVQARAEAVAPRKQLLGGNIAQTRRGVDVPAAKTRNQTLTARTRVDSLDDDQLARVINAPANQTSFATRAEALYENASRQLPTIMRKNDTANPNQIRGQNTKNLVAGLAKEQERSRIPGGVIGGRYAGMADRLKTNLQLPDLRAMRTAVGRDLSNFNYGDTGLDKSQLNALYGALSKDIEISYMDIANRAWERVGRNTKDAVSLADARKADRALYELRRADKYFRQGMTRMERFLDVAGADKPEAAARKMMTALKEGGQADIGKVRSALGALRPEERNDFAALVLREMGTPRDSALGIVKETGFSPQTFTTNFTKMDPRMRQMLFPGEHGAALDDLARVAERMAEVEKFANTSNSGRMATNVGGLVGGLGTAAAGGLPWLAAGAGGSFGLSYLMSRPHYARWAANALRLQSQFQRSPQQFNAAMATHVNRLAQLAKNDPQLQPIVQSFSEVVSVGEGAKEEDRE